MIRLAMTSRAVRVMGAASLLALAACSGERASVSTDPSTTLGSSTGSEAAASTTPSSDPGTDGPVPAGSTTTVMTVPVSVQPGTGSTVTFDTVPMPSTMPLTDPAKAEGGIVVHLTAVAAVTVEAKGPGEVSGPGLRIDLTITNGGTGTFDATPVALTVTVNDAPTSPALSSTVGVAGAVAAGASVTGRYVVTTAAAVTAKDDIVVTVFTVPGRPPVAFGGTLSA